MKVVSEMCVKGGEFVLASGVKSKYYVDIRKISMNGDIMEEIGSFSEELIEDYAINSVGGLETAAIPIISAICMYHRAHSGFVGGFYYRKAGKDHGTKALYEGNIKSPVLLVDDVITTGNSILYMIENLNLLDICVGAIMCVVYRDDLCNDAELKFKNMGIPFYPMIHGMRDLGLLH